MKRIWVSLMIAITACSAHAKRVTCKHFATQAEARVHGKI